jgi:hypothetical protein
LGVLEKIAGGTGGPTFVFRYHSTVGHNTKLELDFAIDREGLVEAGAKILIVSISTIYDQVYYQST